MVPTFPEVFSNGILSTPPEQRAQVDAYQWCDVTGMSPHEVCEK